MATGDKIIAWLSSPNRKGLLKPTSPKQSKRSIRTGKYFQSHGQTMFDRGIDIVQMPGEAVQSGFSAVMGGYTSLLYGAGQRAKAGAGQLAKAVKNRKHLKRKKR